MAESIGYLDALAALLAEVDPTPGVRHVDVRHEETCARWGGKACNCEPEVEMGARIDRKYGREPSE